MSWESKAVFLSYASEDAQLAGRIADALKAAGIEVWFDQSELRGGDAWDLRIRREIRDCALFIPIISRTAKSRPEGYFRLEWRLAAERAMQIADAVPFILPIGLDETDESEAKVPDKFKEVQWTRLTAERALPELTERMVRLVREYRKREKGLL